MFLDAPFTSSIDILNKLLSKLKINFFGYEFDMPGSRLLEKYAFNASVQTIIKYLLRKIASINSPNIETLIKPINPLESVKKIKVPCFFVICKNDEKISPEAVKKIYNNHSGYKRLWITDGRDHCDSVFNDPERYLQTINSFFDDVIENKITNQNRALVIDDYEKK